MTETMQGWNGLGEREEFNCRVFKSTGQGEQMTETDIMG